MNPALGLFYCLVDRILFCTLRLALQEATKFAASESYLNGEVLAYPVLNTLRLTLLFLCCTIYTL